MKTIFFIRHAKSSWDDPALRDIDRPLNKRGKHDAPAMAKLLKEQGIVPDRIISSPAKRALSTAEVFAAEMGIEDIFVEPLIYESMPDDLLKVVQHLSDSLEVVFVFGHNPTLYHLASIFSDTDLDNIPTCGIFEVQAAVQSWADFSSRTGRMIRHFFPKQLKYS
ncbi:MAG: SixA phosphatase family protein [Saprospiraceae bacterium]|jgi:phosphohistidine phosphatase